MMLTAVKGNREEKITEDKKEEYLRAGYDVIVDGVRTPAPSKTVSYAELEKVKLEVEALKADNDKLTGASAALEAENKALKADNDKLAKELEKLNKK